MSTDLSASFNEQYMNINTKMKKRFMRKPNVSEATNEFIALAIQCEHSEQPTFAGHCYIGAAKCEASIGNFLGEAEHYMAAGRQFMKAEKKLWSLRFCSPDRENLEAAIGCFMQAMSKYPEKSPVRVAILMELSNDLVALNHKLEALSYYEQALELVEENTMKIMGLRHLLNLQIDCGDPLDWLHFKKAFEESTRICNFSEDENLWRLRKSLHGAAKDAVTALLFSATSVETIMSTLELQFGKLDMALETANTICDLKLKVPEHTLAEVQVSRILLAILVKPPDDTKPPSLKQLFLDLMNDIDSDALPVNMDLKLKLQSMIISKANGDSHLLVTVASDMKQFLTMHQTELLNKLLSEDRLDRLALS